MVREVDRVARLLVGEGDARVGPAPRGAGAAQPPIDAPLASTAQPLAHIHPTTETHPRTRFMPHLPGGRALQGPDQLGDGQKAGPAAGAAVVTRAATAG
ncbi:MAG: hypothetical protein M5U28_52000 [Sandaracinaceae bacterium]|nr:hypothetical protein [Sandaracinaceae bacterium]